jgi:hypothetical protein
MYLACLSLGGCQLLLDVDSTQCERDADCTGLLGRGYTCAVTGICKRMAAPAGPQADAGPQLAARWKCLDDEPMKPATVNASERVTVKFDVLDFTTLEPPPGLIVRACGPTDVSCSMPLLDGVQPDADGYVTLDLPRGFAGFYEIDAPGFLPGLSAGNRPMNEDTTFQGPTVVSPKAQADLARLGGETIDATLGTVVVEVVDCDGGAGDGVRVEMEDEQDQHAFYFEGALPDRQLPGTVITYKLGRPDGDPRAVAGFSNVKPNYVTFVATLLSPERTVATFAAQVRAGSITFVRMQAGY